MSFKQKMAILVIVPSILVSLIIGIVCVYMVRDYGITTNLTTLKSTNDILLNYIGTGDFSHTDNGDYFGDKSFEECGERMKLLKGAFIVSTIFNQDKRVLTTVDGENVLNTGTDTTIVNNVILNREHYATKNVIIGGDKYCGYYSPLINDKGNVVGMLFTGKSMSTINKSINKLIILIIIIVIIGLVIVINVSMYILGKLLQPLSASHSIITDIANGDISKSTPKIEKVYDDEIGHMYHSAIQLHDSIRNIIVNIKNVSMSLSDTVSDLYENSETVASSTNDIDKSVLDVTQSASSQAEDAQQLTFTSDDMGHTIVHVLQDITNLSTIGDTMDKARLSVLNNLNKLSSSNNNTLTSINQIQEQISVTDASVEEIRSVLDTITDITRQTNLLSLNASIEAARAGEVGKGFSVVATEIRNLAEQSGKSADNINDIISTLLTNFKKTISLMDIVKNSITIQSDDLSNAISTFDDLEVGISDTVNGISGIMTLSKNLETNRVQVIDTISNLSALSEENAATAQVTSSNVQALTDTMEKLKNQAENINNSVQTLLQVVHEFKTE